MPKIIKSALLVLAGVALGLILYEQFAPRGAEKDHTVDTSFVSKALAGQNDTDDGLHKNRVNAVTRAVQIVSPAVVSINVTKINRYYQRSPFYNDPFFRDLMPFLFRDPVVERPVQSIGSGFLVSSDGYVVTNEHVVSGAAEIIVARETGEEFKASLVGLDHSSDIALLKIDVADLPFIRFGNSDDLIIGEWAIALGNPFGLFIKSSPTVTVGVISAVDRDFSPLEGRVYEDMIQTDAAINSGNSGGPLCNADGQVIGMNTFIFTGNSGSGGSVGVGFAIPANKIIGVLEELKDRANKGNANVWIGLYVDNLNAYVARYLRYPSTRGIYASRINRLSPAEKAGVQLGDVILSINGRRVQSTDEAEQIVKDADLRVGDKLKLRIWRAGREYETEIVVEKYPY